MKEELLFYRMRRATMFHEVPFQNRSPRTRTLPLFATVIRVSVEATFVTCTTLWPEMAVR